MPRPPIPARPASITLKMRLLDFEGRPFSDREVHLQWGKSLLRLKTDSRGMLVNTAPAGPVVVPVVPGSGELRVKEGSADLLKLRVVVRAYGPATSISPGEVARLSNLGYQSVTNPADLDDPLVQGIFTDSGPFTRANGVDPTNSAAYFRRLTEAHDDETKPFET